LRLDLKLLADVGIVGLPNAGKSTLLRAISAARPRVGDYPFTTLEPVLGVVESGWLRFVVADIPGLIAGAHEGAGLGLAFLRHIERTNVVVHLIDGASGRVGTDMEAVNRELAEYGHGLGEREQIVAVNKIDIPGVRERRAELEAGLRERGHEPLFISAATGEGVDALVEAMAAALAERGDEAGRRPARVEVAVAPPGSGRTARGVTVRREDGVFTVEGERVVTFAEMMPLDSEEGRAELWRRFGRWGVLTALRRAGAKPGARVRLGTVEVEWPR
jgi:GTP-binding protein